jgi:hypothetical protein
MVLMKLNAYRLFVFFGLTINGFSATGALAQTAASSPSDDTVGLYQRIMSALAGLKQDSSAEYEFVYIMNSVAGTIDMTAQFLQTPFDFAGPTVQSWVSNGSIPSADLLGKPTTFPQLWKQTGSDDQPFAAGSSHLPYPDAFQLDYSVHPHLVLDFVNQTANLPSSP